MGCPAVSPPSSLGKGDGGEWVSSPQAEVGGGSGRVGVSDQLTTNEEK